MNKITYMALAGIACCAVASAAPVAVVNGDFSAPTAKVTDGFAAVLGWGNTGIVYTDTGVEEAPGIEIAFALQSDDGGYQILSYAMVDGEQYNLTWDSSNSWRADEETVTLLSATATSDAFVATSQLASYVGALGAKGVWASQSLSYTATAADAGKYLGISFDNTTTSGSDTYANWDNFAVVITTSTPSAPEWNEDPIIGNDAIVGLDYNSTIADKAIDPNGNTVIYSIVAGSGPTWLALNSDGTMSGVVPALSGTNTWTVNASDGVLSTDAELKIFVKESSPPEWMTNNITASSANIDKDYSGTLAGMASDPDGEEITYSLVGTSTWLTVSSEGLLTGQPALGDLGPNTFTIAADTPLDNPVNATLNILVTEDALASAIVAVIDAGGETEPSAFFDRSTDGKSVGAMTWSFVADAADYDDDTAHSGSQWDGSEYSFENGTGKTATWTFGSLPVGSRWGVYVSWRNMPQDNLSTAVPYTYNGTSISVDQKVGATDDIVLLDAAGDAINFQTLGTAMVDASGELVVTMSSAAESSAADNWATGDAIAIVAMAAPAPIPVTDLLISAPDSGNMVLSWTGISGRSYGVQTNIDLVFGSWGTLITGIPGTAGTIVTNIPVGPDKLFYQIISE